jgi:hypothetical protein
MTDDMSHIRRPQQRPLFSLSHPLRSPLRSSCASKHQDPVIDTMAYQVPLFLPGHSHGSPPVQVGRASCSVCAMGNCQLFIAEVSFSPNYVPGPVFELSPYSPTLCVSVVILGTLTCPRAQRSSHNHLPDSRRVRASPINVRSGTRYVSTIYLLHS